MEINMNLRSKLVQLHVREILRRYLYTRLLNAKRHSAFNNGPSNVYRILFPALIQQKSK